MYMLDTIHKRMLQIKFTLFLLKVMDNKRGLHTFWVLRKNGDQIHDEVCYAFVALSKKIHMGSWIVMKQREFGTDLKKKSNVKSYITGTQKEYFIDTTTSAFHTSCFKAHI